MASPSQLSRLLTALERSGFSGDIETSSGARIAAATDNSIYQIEPEAIFYPRSGDEVRRIVALAREVAPALPITARGGATGTNGQSLNRGLIIDTTRHLDRILSLDVERREVTLEPGVTLETLNRELARHGLFFPPDVSSGSRATLGGMVATDAAGKGSRIWGKTSDYIRSLSVVLADGSAQTFAPQPVTALEAEPASLPARLHRLLAPHREAIDRGFPRLNRGLTGYNLQQALATPGLFDPTRLLAGSEGTLAITTAMMLRVVPLPAHRRLIAIGYGDFMRMLNHVSRLLDAGPAAIEVLDDRILERARHDAVWQQAGTLFAGFDPASAMGGMAYVELLGDDAEALADQAKKITAIVARDREKVGIVGMVSAQSPREIGALWAIRRRAVGLLGASRGDGDRRPLAFVEDTAVPPERLCDYIADFRRLLDRHGLQYGMYGHADVGCLHVRPALDMTLPEDRALIREISDEVVELVTRHGGVFWGEHGKGFRGEYLPRFFGPELMPLLRQVKTLFDPDNRLNPGKLVAPDDAPSAQPVRLDETPFRGAIEQQIPVVARRSFAPAFACNGNALCQNRSPDSVMCPSYKSLRDKRHSPKGRAAMLRQWLATPDDATLEKELHASLQRCLSCAACRSGCPLDVDVPELKSKFLEKYFLRHRRPLRDRIFFRLEHFAALGRRTPTLVNALAANPVSRMLTKKILGIVDPPRFRPMRRDGATTITSASEIKPSEHAVILLPDSFNASFDGGVIDAARQLLGQSGYQVYLTPVWRNGKALHVRGQRRSFRRIAARQHATMRELAATGLPLIALDSATRLLHDNEYAAILDARPDYQVQSLEQWLADEIDAGRLAPKKRGAVNPPTPLLLPHCMEQSADRASIDAWQSVFRAFGFELETRMAGCCGMSGIFGHEAENAVLSRHIFSQNWQAAIDDAAGRVLLATGFSCRCQLGRFGYTTSHPVEWLVRQSLDFVNAQ